MDIKPDDVLWYVPNSGVPCEVTVDKVGRVWFTVKKYRKDRFSIDNGYADGRGYSSHGRCYVSREAYESKVELDRLWQAFRMDTQNRFNTPPEVGAEEILQAAKILRFVVKE